MRFTLALLLALLSLGAAQARELTTEETAALEQRVETFNTAMTDNDFAGIMSVVPPAVITTLAEANAMSVEDLVAAMEAVMTEAMASVTFVSFGMDLDAARHEELADGTPYVMIPTETVMDMGGEKMRASGDTLAMMDGGEWYLVRVSETAQVEILKQVYPGFAQVDFSAGTLEAVE